MKAAILREIDRPLEIVDLDVREPGEDEVLIEVRASGICHSDVSVARADYGHPLPLLLGHEVSGVAVAVGSHVVDVAIGDHVVTCLAAACGACRSCLRGRGWGCLRRAELTRPGRLLDAGNTVGQFAGIGGFAEQVLVHHKHVVTVDRGIPFDRAALLGCSVVTGVGAVLNAALVGPSDTVAVLGCGGVGLNVVQGARLRGAAAIVAIDTDPRKLELAREFGATAVVDASATGPVEAVVAMTDGGADHAFEVVGRPQTLQQVYAMLAPAGHAYAIGMQQPATDVMLSASALTARSKTLHGVHMGHTAFKVDIPFYTDLYLQGRLELDLLIAERIELGEVNRAMASIGAAGGARSVLAF